MTLTAKQIEERVTYIGSTDAPAILNLSRYKTILQVWAEKTGEIKAEDISDELPVKLGNMLEETVAQLFMEKTGKKVHRVKETVRHKKYPFIAANLDRRVVGEDAILECKTTAGWKSKEWAEEEIPAEYIIQCFHQLAVTGKKKCYLAVLIGNQDFIYREIERDEKVINDLIKREVNFWKTFVEPKAMPLIVTKNDADTLDKLFPNAAQGKTIDLPDEANILIESLTAMKQDRNGLEGQIEKLENELKILLKDAEIGTTSLNQVSWRNYSSTRINVKRLRKEEPAICERFENTKRSRKLSYHPLNINGGQ